jgi:hypothetical protein
MMMTFYLPAEILFSFVVVMLVFYLPAEIMFSLVVVMLVFYLPAEILFSLVVVMLVFHLCAQIMFAFGDVGDADASPTLPLNPVLRPGCGDADVLTTWGWG